MSELKQRLEQLLIEKFKEEIYHDLFIVDIQVKPNDQVFVFLESDSQLTIGMCSKISRYLEHHIEENGWLGEKYTIEVSSPGVGNPLKLPRQFRKNIGRLLSVKVADDHKHKVGTLTTVSDQGIILEHEEKRQIEGRKKKEKVTIETEIAFDQIEKAVVKIQF